MVELVAPNGAVVQAREEAVQGLLDAGFQRVIKPAQPALRKGKATRRTTKRTAKG